MLIPGAAMLIGYAVKMMVVALRPARRPPEARRSIDDDTLARLDEIAARAPRARKPDA